MSADQSTDLLRRLYAAYNEQDIAAIDGMLSPGFTMHVGGAHALSGTYRGRDEVWPYLAKVASVLQGRTPGGWDVHAITADDSGHAVALLRGYSGDFSRPVIHVWHIEDGLATEHWDTTMDQIKEDAFWNEMVAAAGA